MSLWFFILSWQQSENDQTILRDILSVNIFENLTLITPYVVSDVIQLLINGWKDPV